jgi:hypothetical protein
VGGEGGGSTGSTQSVLCHVHTLGNRTRRSVSNGCAHVPEGFAAAKLESLITWEFIAELPRIEPADCPATLPRGGLSLNTMQSFYQEARTIIRIPECHQLDPKHSCDALCK